MNLYLMSQDKVGGYDSYDSLVVAAESPEDAKNIHPSSYVTHISNDEWMGTYLGGSKVGDEYPSGGDEWVEYSDINCIEVELLGETTKERGVVLASFNAG